jgi:hypothetical protein
VAAVAFRVLHFPSDCKEHVDKNFAPPFSR